MHIYKYCFTCFQTTITEVPGKTLNEKLQNALVKLQVMINCIVDGDSDKLAADKITGVKQVHSSDSAVPQIYRCKSPC